MIYLKAVVLRRSLGLLNGKVKEEGSGQGSEEADHRLFKVTSFG